MPLQPGDVVRLFDNLATPPKWKRFVCVSPEDGWFMRINSEPRHDARRNVQLPRKGNECCLEHDSYLDLYSILEFDDSVVDDSLQMPANDLGPLSKESLYELINATRSAVTLTPEQQEKVCGNLAARAEEA